MEGWVDLDDWFHTDLPAGSQSPIQVLTRPDVVQLRWSDTARYRYSTPPI